MNVEEFDRNGLTITHETEDILVGEVSDPYKLVKMGGQESHNRGALFIVANSVNTYIHYVADNYKTPQRNQESSGKSSSFYSTNTFEEAVELYLTKPHTIRTFEEKDVDIRTSDNMGNDVQFDVVGDFLDIGRYLEGIPETFGNMVMGNPRSLFVDVTFNLSYPGYVDASVMNYRGKRLMRLVDWLESHGVRTKLSAIHATNIGVNLVHVKQYHDPLDLDALAIVGHSDFNRRIRFRVAEWSKTFESGYGHAHSLGTKAALDGSTIKVMVNWYDSDYSVDEAFTEIEKNIETILTESGAVIG